MCALFCALACESPPAPGIPPRDQIGPPPPAASRQGCPRTSIANFGNDWYLLADLDQGTACYAYLERDECVLGIFSDCNTLDDPRQWRGRGELVDVPNTVPLQFNKIAQLWTQYPATTNGAGRARKPRCCMGEVTASATASWSLMTCGLTSCGTPGDATHPGLYLERLDPTMDATRSVQASLLAPDGVVSMTSDDSTQTLWLASERELYTFDPVAKSFESKAVISLGGLITAGQGITYASDGAQLHILRGDETQVVALPGAIVAMQARASDVLLALDTPGGPILQAVDGPTGTRTATAALPAEMASMHGEGPTFATLKDGVSVYVVEPDLSLSPFFDTRSHAKQTETSFPPTGLAAFPGGAAFLGPCHLSASRVHCVFESRGDQEPRRFAVAGVQRLQALFEDPAEERWITVSAQGHITQVQRGSGRPYLTTQIRLQTPVVAAAFVAEQRVVYVLADGQLIPVDLTLIE